MALQSCLEVRVLEVFEKIDVLFKVGLQVDVFGPSSSSDRRQTLVDVSIFF